MIQVGPYAGPAYGPQGEKPGSAAWWKAVTGYTPEHAYLCDEASGDLIDRVGSDDLSIVGSPRYRGSPTSGSIFGVEGDEGDFDAFEAAASTVWDHGNESVGMVSVVYVRAATGSTFRAFTGGKWDGSIGYRQSWTKQTIPLVRQQLDDNITSVSVAPDYEPAAGDLLAAVAAVDRTTDVSALALAPQDGSVISDSADVSGVGDVTNAVAMRLLSMTGAAAADITLLCCALFGGSDADGMAADVARIARRVRQEIYRWA